MTEAQIQKQVFAEIRARRIPNMLAWHVPNDKASRRKPGFLAGVSDVHVLHRGKFYAIELKKDGGRASEEQLEFIANVNSAGGFGVVAEGLTETINILQACGLIRKEAA